MESGDDGLEDDFVPRTKEYMRQQNKKMLQDLAESRRNKENKRRREHIKNVRAKAKKKQKITQENAHEKAEVLEQIEKFVNNKTNLLDTKAVAEINTYYPALAEDKIIGWQPFPGPQEDFLASDETEVLFSGGRAPGKSDALMMDALRYCKNKNFRGLVIRKAMDELRDLIRRAKELYPQCYPGTKWKEQEKLFVFPSGATIEFGYCDHEDDVMRYQGQEYSWLGVDELTEIPKEETYEKLIASVRRSGAGKNYIRATTNPNGPGKTWVKKRFVDKGPMGETIPIVTHIKQINKTVKTTRKWIHGTVFDNPKIVNERPEYIAMLQNIDNEVLRKQWFEGDWDSADGLAFDEFSRRTHVIEPFDIPPTWYRFRACDWGFKTKAVCLWFAIDPDGNIYVYREFVAGGQTPRGKMYAKQFGAEIKRIEDEAGEHVRYGVLDASAWSQRGEDAPAPAEDMAGISWRPSDRTKHSRITGKLQVHNWLQTDEFGEPKCKIFNTCLDLISCLASLPMDKNNPEDVDTNCDDHAYDAFRYGLMSRPRAYNNYNMQLQQSEPPIIYNKKFGF